jgi:hypothetical protein
MKNNITFLAIIVTIFFLLACNENKPQASSKPLAGEEHLAGQTVDMEVPRIPVQYIDFDTIDIEADLDFAGLDIDMD